MKFNVATKDVTSSGEISSRKITLSASAKAFKIVFEKMYPDIMKAMVRELFTNAWDSQKNAGNLDTPIEIHLPTKWEPYFAIRDFGTGMTPQVVDDVYSVVFESTKDDSQEEAGMFGMGSKTPLGYTDSFSVTSFVDGQFWYYDIYHGTTGEPIISLKATGETDEPNGVEVQVAILESDWDKIKKHVEYFVLGANTPVNINKERFLQKRNVVREGNGWQLYEFDRAAQTTTLIRMGCVLYPLVFSYIRGNISGTKYSYSDITELDNFFKKPFVLDFNIGDFDVASSREDIIYNKDAVEKIVSKMESVVEEITARGREEIKVAPTYGDAYRIYHEYKSAGFPMKEAKYGALKFYPGVIYSDRFKFSMMMKPYKHNKKIAKFEAGHLDIGQLHMKGIVRNYFILEKEGTEVKQFRGRMTNFMETIEKGRLGYGSYYSNRGFNVVYIKYKDEAHLKRLHPYIPNNSIFIDIMDIEPMKKVRLKKEENGIERTKYLIEKRYEFEFSNWVKEIEEGGYFVTAEYTKLDQTYNEIKKAITFLGIDLMSTPVYIMGKSQRHLIPKLKMVNLVDTYREKSKHVTYNDDTIKHGVYQVLKNDFSSGNGHYHFVLSDEFKAAHLKVLEFDETKIEIGFDRFINEAVNAKFNDVLNEVGVIIENYIGSNPMFQYIERSRLAVDFVDIEKTIKEISK